MKKLGFKGILMIAVGILLLSFILPLSKLFANWFKVTPDPKAEAQQNHEQNSYSNLEQMIKDDYFDPDYWKQYPSAHLITRSNANFYCEVIKEAKGVFNDDEDAIYGVFQQLQYKTQVSWLSQIFFENYGISLLGYLNGFMNDSELATIANITQKLK